MKSYPPGVHQEMIYEVANDEWVHTSIMSGLTPIKSQDEILDVPEASDPLRYPTLSPEERAAITPKRRAAYKARDARRAARRVPRPTTTQIEAIVTMEENLGAAGTPHPQLVANDMIATVDDPRLGRTTQVGVPIHMASTPGGDQRTAARTGRAQRRDLRRARLLDAADRRVSAVGAA